MAEKCETTQQQSNHQGLGQSNKEQSSNSARHALVDQLSLAMRQLQQAPERQYDTVW